MKQETNCIEVCLLKTVETKPVSFYMILNLLHETKVTGACKDYPWVRVNVNRRNLLLTTNSVE